MKKILILSALLILTGAGCVATKGKASVITPTEPVVCTMDAKQCPNGSYVGRSGPKCEFAACPDTKAPQTNNDWQTITIGGVVSFQIPPNCHTGGAAGSTYITCPTADNETPIPEFSFSSDGIQVNMKRYEDLESAYWKDVLASMKVIQPLAHKIQINIDE